MASLTSIIIGGLELILGAILLATGVGGGLGVKLLLGGALTLLSSFLTAKTGRGGFSSSPTYGFDNLGNAQFEGSPVPIIYGRHRVQPGIISTNLKIEAATQVLYLLCLVGEGTINSISRIRLNDVALESFPGVVATTDRLGSLTQTVIPGFNETGQQYQAGTRLTLGETHVHEMRASADSLVFSLLWPTGFHAISGSGNISTATWTGKVQYKTYGAPDSNYKTIDPPSADGTWKLDGSQAGTWKATKKSQEAMRLQLPLKFDGLSGRPPKGRYTVRITSMGPSSSNSVNMPDVASVLELTNDNNAYAGYALLGLKIPVTSQINSIPKVSCVAEGIQVVDFRISPTTRVWSRNPVLCAYDLLTNDTYGLGIAVSKMDTTSWTALANACDVLVTPAIGGAAEATSQLDYVVDVESVGADHLAQMLATCEMTLVNADRKIYIVQDAVKASSRTFEGRVTAPSNSRWNIRDSGNPSRSTLVASSLDYLQRYNSVRVQYRDEVKDWENRVVEVRDTYINVGAITGTFGVGNRIKGTTSKAVGRLTASYVNGNRYLTYVQDDSAAAFITGETITDLTSGATVTSSSAPYTATPYRPLNLQLFGITRRSQALRRARKALNDARSRVMFATWGGILGDLDLLPGDVVDVSCDHLSWVQRYFTILNLGFDAEGMASFNCREYNADVYTDNVDSSQADAVTFLPGGAVPPGLRNVTTSQPGTAASPNTMPLGQVTSLSIKVS